MTLRYFTNRPHSVWLSEAAVLDFELLRAVARAPDQRHSKFEHVYPIVRVDTPFDQTYPTNTVAVVKVVTSQADAEVEVARHELNANKRCVYFYCTSRLISSFAAEMWPHPPS